MKVSFFSIELCKSEIPFSIQIFYGRYAQITIGKGEVDAPARDKISKMTASSVDSTLDSENMKSEDT